MPAMWKVEFDRAGLGVLEVGMLSAISWLCLKQVSVEETVKAVRRRKKPDPRTSAYMACELMTRWFPALKMEAVEEEDLLPPG